MMTHIVREGAASLSQQSILFFDVRSLETCGTVYISGLVFLSLRQPRFVITFIILGIWRGYCDLHIISLK